MKYFIDTEFHEYKRKPFLSKAVDTIELISIGIVAEDGREYYAISKDFDIKAAWKNEWLRENVLSSIYEENVHVSMRGICPFSFSSIKAIIKGFGKSNKQIAEGIVDFVNPNIQDLIEMFTRHDQWLEIYYPKEFDYIKVHNTNIPEAYWKSGADGNNKNKKLIYNQPEFYGYYSDYDWVVFCWLFGRMIDLPKGFPMYCIDLKQMFDDRASKYNRNDFFTAMDFKDENLAELTQEEKVKHLKMHVSYPSQTNEHNALFDAKWNMDLYKFIKQLR